jgi:hypothetical protein
MEIKDAIRLWIEFRDEHGNTLLKPASYSELEAYAEKMIRRVLERGHDA